MALSIKDFSPENSIWSSSATAKISGRFAHYSLSTRVNPRNGADVYFSQSAIALFTSIGIVLLPLLMYWGVVWVKDQIDKDKQGPSVSSDFAARGGQSTPGWMQKFGQIILGFLCSLHRGGQRQEPEP
jgi:hypothetical protein